MKKLSRVLKFLRNKYAIALIAFIVWMIFFDRNDLISQFSAKKKLNKLEKDRKYYIEEIKKNEEDMKNLMTDPKNLEKFGREKYLMKKDNEEVFVIVKEKKK
jgi:cell division protein FtsB